MGGNEKCELKRRGNQRMESRWTNYLVCVRYVENREYEVQAGNRTPVKLECVLKGCFLFTIIVEGCNLSISSS